MEKFHSSSHSVYKKTSEDYLKLSEGITRKTLVYGEKTLLTEFQLQKGKELPRHQHPHEQTGYLISGKIVLIIGQEEYQISPGDSWCIPGNVEHKAIVLEDAVAIEVFSPVREDYIHS
ncbi:cupin domain-containing protein [Heliophilum fasciatum]|uniref:Cupin domain n=1 Tax=Heliophilum fasciatum TaxID=35700 RepID=A0A4R2RD58_9FIRM|nr:cupin domain-containing protein [Heliophilum fasciatum]MCW2279398.1 quercetin dioxygenase-like cupin family protein [Heliophilum fasciatum]TCP60089.1 cupin domain [Heliophilum fasciatum]